MSRDLERIKQAIKTVREARLAGIHCQLHNNTLPSVAVALASYQAYLLKTGHKEAPIQNTTAAVIVDEWADVELAEFARDRPDDIDDPDEPLLHPQDLLLNADDEAYRLVAPHEIESFHMPPRQRGYGQWRVHVQNGVPAFLPLGATVSLILKATDWNINHPERLIDQILEGQAGHFRWVQDGEGGDILFYAVKEEF